MSLLDTLELEGLTPARLWSALDPDTRRRAAESLYDSSWKDDSGRLEAESAIAATLRFRPVAVRRLPTQKRIGYLLRTVRPDDSLANTLLLALHLGARQSMLVVFLEQLGIPHEDGVIQADEFDRPDPERLAPAVDALHERFPEEQVEVYLATLIAMEPEAWSGLIPVLRDRRR